MVVLAGPETEALGRFAIRVLSPAAAIAMSAGRLPKHPPPIDPNEDAAFVAVGPAGALAVVIDGHLGFTVAAAVLDEFKLLTEDLLSTHIPDPERAVEKLVRHIKQVGDEALRTAADERSRSGAALSIALIASGRVAVATVGDTVAWLAAPRGKPRRFQRGSPFLRNHSGHVRVEVVRAPQGGRLLLATDGLVDYTSDKVVPTLLASTLGREPREAAYTLMDAALLGGAGDNVTVLCLDLDLIGEAAEDVI